MNFYKRYLGDYARDTAHLSLMEHGAYQVLLDTYYATDGALPAEKEELYRIARAMTPAERKAVDRVAGQFFAVNGDGTRHNKRADEEIASAASYADAQAMRAHKRWQNQPDMPAHKPAQCPADASHSHSHRKEKNKGIAFALPDWIPADAWADFVEMRKKKHPLTPRAMELTVRDLAKLREEGHDPRAVLEEAVKRTWRGVFPVPGAQTSAAVKVDA